MLTISWQHDKRLLQNALQCQRKPATIAKRRIPVASRLWNVMLSAIPVNCWIKNVLYLRQNDYVNAYSSNSLANPVALYWKFEKYSEKICKKVFAIYAHFWNSWHFSVLNYVNLLNFNIFLCTIQTVFFNN